VFYKNLKTIKNNKMKKTSILLALITAGTAAFGQVRTTLYEEFTGENCNPCAAVNPQLNALLASPSASQVIALKWQVPIPSAPSTTWSLYKTNQAEIDYRYRGTPSGYGYPAQYSQTNTATSGINSAPTGLLDGKHAWQFGATSDHPFYLTATVINSANVQPTNFSIAMTTSWSPTFTNCIVTTTLTSSSNFTSTGNMMFRLCLVERTINFNTAPGSNGEKDFYDAVRKSYPTVMSGTAVTSMGTAITNTWTAGQTVTLQLSCNIPSYIIDYGQMAFVGFIQEDIAGNVNKPVYQAARSAQPSIPNEAKAISVAIPSVVCTNSFAPTVTIKNNGNNAITSMTITPYVDGVAGTNVIWNGNLASGSNTTIPMNTSTAAVGPHTYSYNISGVSGGDIVLSNNGTSAPFLSSTSYFAGPVTEGFVNPSFPPANWSLFNLDGNPNTFVRSTLAGGYGTSSESMMYQVNSAANGDVDDIFLPPTDLTGITSPQLSFDLSYCQVATSNKDSLNIWMSSNCGSTWTRVYGNGGTPMATAPTNSVTFFVPTAAQWTTVTIPLPAYANQSQVLCKFSVKSNYGNRMFIDNINLMQANVTGVKQLTEQRVGVDLYPNPTSNETSITVSTTQSGDAHITVFNAIGQQVYNRSHSISSGTNNIALDCRNMADGVYMVNVDCNGKAITKKLVITR
jgi:hypothetical protein